ncbi:MAG: hypothetical protein L3J52_05210, partial [Proteobacteria bacterium]|nr:hypothetical protein [Pseudomonadota bacterium]
MRKTIVLTLLCVINFAYANDFYQKKAHSNLKEYMDQVDQISINEEKYIVLLRKVEPIFKSLLNAVKTDDFPYEELPELSHIIAKFGPAMSAYQSLFRKHAKDIGNPESFLGSAMIQDISSLYLLKDKIFSSGHLSQAFYIKLLALYGDKAGDFLPLLKNIEESHWYKPLRHVAKSVIEKINNNYAENDWGRYQIWQELKDDKKFCSNAHNTSFKKKHIKTNNITEFATNKLTRPLGEIQREDVSQVWDIESGLGLDYLVKLNNYEMIIIDSDKKKVSIKNG